MKQERLNLRASSATVARIDQAAAALGQDRTSFMIDAATARAEDVLTSRFDDPLVFVSDAVFDEVLAHLAQAPDPSAEAVDRIRRARLKADERYKQSQ